VHTGSEILQIHIDDLCGDEVHKGSLNSAEPLSLYYITAKQEEHMSAFSKNHYVWPAAKTSFAVFTINDGVILIAALCV
jgi:hypothetical protein